MQPVVIRESFVKREYLTEPGRTGTIYSDWGVTWVERQEAPKRADEPHSCLRSSQKFSLSGILNM